MDRSRLVRRQVTLICVDVSEAGEALFPTEAGFWKALMIPSNAAGARNADGYAR